MGIESSNCAPNIPCVTSTENEPNETKAKDEFLSKKTLSKESTKAINCAHLIGSIIKKFFESEENQCDQIDPNSWSLTPGIDTASILSNILIIGSAPRNYLLRKPINKLLIAINTRELTKLQLMHLRKYHKTETSQNSNSQCILWRIYLNRFLETTDVMNMDKTKKKYEYIADCNYILNAYFMVDYILKKYILSELRDKLSIHRDEVTKIYECQIIDEMVYPDTNCDLDGQFISIFDITDKMMVYKQLFGTKISNKQQLRGIHAQHRLKLRKLHDNENSLGIQQFHHPQDSISMSFSVGTFDFRAPTNTLSRLDSLPAIQFRINDKPLNVSTQRNTHNNVLPIELPFYEVKLRKVMKLMDFSINTLFIRLSDIMGIKNDKEDKEEEKDEFIIKYEENVINYELKNKIKNGLEDYNALSDFKNKVLTHPFPLKVIECYGVEGYFWKIVRFGVLLNSWKIDDKLVTVAKEKYHPYLDSDMHWNAKNGKQNDKKNYQVFVDMMFKENICYNQSIKQYQRMIDIFSKLDIHSKLIQVMSHNTLFNQYFIQSINTLDSIHKNDIIDMFAKHGYVVAVNNNNNNDIN